MAQPLRFYASGLLLAATLTALSAGCAKTASSVSTATASSAARPNPQQLEALKQSAEQAAAAKAAHH